jgi:hypothetical protein
MAYKKGEGGRPKGASNKLTKTFKELVSETVQKLNDNPKTSMENWAVKNQTEFWKIASKLIPTEVQAKVEATIVKVVRE